MFAKLPDWLEALVLRALKTAVSPEDVAATIAALQAEVFTRARALAAKTATTFDDKLVEMVEDAFTVCTPDVAFLCELVEKGEAAMVAFLRAAAARSDTKLDDAAVDILEEALKAV